MEKAKFRLEIDLDSLREKQERLQKVYNMKYTTPSLSCLIGDDQEALEDFVQVDKAELGRAMNTVSDIIHLINTIIDQYKSGTNKKLDVEEITREMFMARFDNREFYNHELTEDDKEILFTNAMHQCSITPRRIMTLLVETGALETWEHEEIKEFQKYAENIKEFDCKFGIFETVYFFDGSDVKIGQVIKREAQTQHISSEAVEYWLYLETDEGQVKISELNAFLWSEMRMKLKENMQKYNMEKE